MWHRSLHPLWPQASSVLSQVFSAPILTEEEGVVTPCGEKMREGEAWLRWPFYALIWPWGSEGAPFLGSHKLGLSPRLFSLTVDIQSVDFFP